MLLGKSKILTALKKGLATSRADETLIAAQQETKKTLRRWREEAWNKIQDKTRKGEIREDDKFRGKDELQKVIDEYTKKVDELVERKTNEIQID